MRKFILGMMLGTFVLATTLWWVATREDAAHHAPAAALATTRQQPDTSQASGALPARRGVGWFKGSVDEAFAVAKREGKPVFVFWGASWCPYCQALKASVFSRLDFIEQATRVISVELDGDLPEGQKAGEQFRVIGYPTLILFRPDRTEITRVSGGMDLEQYADVIRRSLQDQRPIAEVLAAVIKGSTDASAADCRRLSFHGWDLETDAESPPAERAVQLNIAADRCAFGDGVDFARLKTHALGILLRRESESIARGARASPELIVGVKSTLTQIFVNPAQVRGAADILASLNDALYTVVGAQGSEFADRFHTLWSNALNYVANDAHFGESERLLALATALNAEQKLRIDHTVPEELAAQARAQTTVALANVSTAENRHDIINAARIVYTVLGDDSALYRMLVAELPKTSTPYYYMPTLASIQEKEGKTKEALSWLEMAYAATKTPGARAKWGTTYLRGLIRMTPDDVAGIERVAIEVAEAMSARDAQLPPSPDRSKRFTEALTQWATNPERKRVAAAVANRLLS